MGFHLNHKFKRYCVHQIFLKTGHYTLLTVNCSFNCAHCPLNIVFLTLFTTHCPLDTAICTLHTSYCTLHTSHTTLHTVQCTLHTAYCPLPTGHCWRHRASKSCRHADALLHQIFKNLYFLTQNRKNRHFFK